jgi:hypothetical protein
MKNIPIVILNKDRLVPTKMLVESLHKKGYYNITIIDNQSTYPLLLEWYANSKLDVFYNNVAETKFDNGTFAVLAGKASYAPGVKHPKFSKIVEDYYIFTDSDVIPIDEIPDDFVEKIIQIHKKYNNSKHKIGLGLKLDDLPKHQILAQDALQKEAPYWDGKIEEDGFELYPHPVDTTFAIYTPQSVPGWGANCFRMGGNYMARHIPWYYDINNMPEDEIYYLKNLQENKGPYYSWKIKQMI